MKAPISLASNEEAATSVPIRPRMKAPQLENGARTATGAEVESTRYASLARETRWASVTGRLTWPTGRALQ
jgi:hypothetical protein